MKRLFCLFLLLLLLAGGSFAQAAPPLPPPPTEWVTDTTADFLSVPTREALNQRLQTYERTSGHQMLVWIGKSTGGVPTEEWSARVFQAWRVGRKGIDDGLVLFILTEDHTARIEVGYGLEGQVTDASAARILREEIIPRIRSGDHDGAVTAGIDRLTAVIGGAGAPPEDGMTPLPPLAVIALMILLGLFLIGAILLCIRDPSLALSLFFMLLSGGRGGNGGGKVGGGWSGGGGRSGGGGATGRW